jgi:hypothetical protein
MAAESLSYWDYVKEAFTRKAVLPGLGKMPLNTMGLGLFAVLGLANPGFWLLGAAAETAYLFLVSSSARFQKLVQGERLLERQQGWESNVQQAVATLAPAARDRYRRLLAQCRLILGLSANLDGDSLGSYRDLRSRHLNQLLWIFVRLLGSQQAIQENLSETDRKHLERGIADLERRLEAVDEAREGALARSLQGTLEIQRRRLANLDRAATNLAVIEAELTRIEQQAELLREESAISGQPEVLSERLDAVTSTMSETSRFLDEHAEFFGSLAAGEAESAAIGLPRMPETVEEG